MKDALHILNSAGDLKVEWDPANAAEVEDARQMVTKLQAEGYAFFRVDGTPIGDFEAGLAALNCRRVSAAEVVKPAKGGRRKAEPETTVATRPLRGG